MPSWHEFILFDEELTTHTTDNPIDHPDNSITNAKIVEVLLGKLTRSELSGGNIGAVTVTAITTPIVDLSLGAVVNGDRVLVVANITGSKGGTAGETAIVLSLQLASTCTGVWLNDAASINSGDGSTPASGSFRHGISGIFLVTGSGSCIVRLSGFSSGSNLTVNAGAAQIYGLALRNG